MEYKYPHWPPKEAALQATIKVYYSVVSLKAVFSAFCDNKFEKCLQKFCKQSQFAELGHFYDKNDFLMQSLKNTLYHRSQR
jgi:hypothetical protein